MVVTFGRSQNNLTAIDRVPKAIQQAPVADLANPGLLNNFANNVWVYFSQHKDISITQLPFLPYSKSVKKYEHFIPAEVINGKTVLRFTIANSSDRTIDAYFCPGFLIDTISLYRLRPMASPGEIEALPKAMPDDPDSLGYRRLSMGPHDTATFFAVLSFIKASTNSLNPSLTRDTLIKQGIILNHQNKTNIE